MSVQKALLMLNHEEFMTSQKKLPQVVVGKEAVHLNSLKAAKFV